LKNNCIKEITELHTFFEEWFNGTLDQNKTNFRRVEKVLDTNFELITPNGIKQSRKEIISLLWEACGSRADTENPLNIWIENHIFKQIGTDLYIATYEEWQKDQQKKRGRLSTAVFQKEMNEYNDLVWLHVHETWL
jgi:hypothetical protein